MENLGIRVPERNLEALVIQTYMGLLSISFPFQRRVFQIRPELHPSQTALQILPRPFHQVLGTQAPPALPEEAQRQKHNVVQLHSCTVIPEKGVGRTMETI